ncbi:hypothetical protein D3C80_2042920 [compost metagenome]
MIYSTIMTLLTFAFMLVWLYATYRIFKEPTFPTWLRLSVAGLSVLIVVTTIIGGVVTWKYF